MSKKTAIVMSFVSALLLITPALAQDSISSTRVKPILTQATPFQERIETRKLAEASKSALFRQRLDNTKAKIASREAGIRVKLQQFRDKQKASIAERVNTNLNKINQNQTDTMLNNLERMSQLLDKLAERVDKGTPDIKDPAAANQAIADARETIDKAKKAVETQAQKDYTITVTSEARIKLDAQTKRDQLHKNITEVRNLVIEAKKAVSDAVRVARGEAKEASSSSEVKEGTASGSE